MFPLHNTFTSGPFTMTLCSLCRTKEAAKPSKPDKGNKKKYNHDRWGGKKHRAANEELDAAMVGQTKLPF